MEANNMKAMREALESTEELLEHFAKPGSILADAFALHMRDNRAALAEPVRNCDVGTPKEQAARFNEYCRRTTICKRCLDCMEGEHPIPFDRQCMMEWSQMPYEAPAAKEEGEE